MYKITIFAFLFLLGCQPGAPEQNLHKSYFDINGFLKTLIKTQALQNASVTKISFANGIKEKVEVNSTDTVFWETELTPFLNLDINKPSFTDAYSKQEGVAEETSNLKRIIYEALPNTNTSVKKLEIKYLNSPTEVRQILAIIKKNNPVYNSWQKVHLWTNKYGSQLLVDSLKITGYNKTIMQDSLTYESKVIVKH